MKTNYEFQGNKIIKTMELNKEEINILKEVAMSGGIYINPSISINLKINNLIEEIPGGYSITKLGENFIYQYNQKSINKITNNEESTNPNILQIPTKFQFGQTVYTIKQTRPENLCHVCTSNKICNGTGKIIYNGKHMTYPECKKTDKIINIVDDRKFTVKVIKTATHEDGLFTVKYKIKSNFDILNRAECNLFATKEEAQARCDKLNDPRIDVKVSDIKVSSDFKNSKPSIGKILKKLDYYNRYGKFNTDIILDKDNILIDGYINYLICQLLHIETVKVIIKEKLLNKKEN